jgi:hypothetical protein
VTRETKVIYLKIKVMKNLKKKKKLLILLAILLTVIGLGIVTSVIMSLIPISIILTFPLLLLIVYKIGKDVDVIVDAIFLMELSEEGGVFEGIVDLYIDEEEELN